MSRVECIQETLVEFLDNIGISLTKEQSETLANDLIVGIDMYDEVHSSEYLYNFTNPYEDEVKQLKKDMDEMYSQKAYLHLEDKLEDHKREIRRLKGVIDDYKRMLKNN